MSECRVLYFVRLIVIVGLIQQCMTTADVNTIKNGKNKEIHLTKRGITDYLHKTAEYLKLVDTTIKPKPDFITNFDMLKIRNKEYARQVFKCVANQGQCDSLGKRMIATVKEEIRNECKLCSKMQKYYIRRIINYGKKCYPNKWSLIRSMYGKNYKSIQSDEEITDCD